MPAIHSIGIVAYGIIFAWFVLQHEIKLQAAIHIRTYFILGIYSAIFGITTQRRSCREVPAAYQPADVPFWLCTVNVNWSTLNDIVSGNCPDVVEEADQSAGIFS